MSQPYGDQSTYPSYSEPEPAAPAVAPASTHLAVNLMFVLAGLALLNLILAFVFRDQTRRAIATANTGFSQSQLDSAVTAAIAVGIVIGLVFLVLYVLLAFQVRKGKNWARIITVILAAFGILGGVSALVGSGSAVSTAVSITTAIIDIALIVLLFRRDSNAYFSRPRT